MQYTPERELLTIQALIKKRPRGCRTPLMNAGDGSPTTSHQSAETSHRTADAPPDFLNCPTKSLRRAMELIHQRRSTVVRRDTDIAALGQPHKEGERCGLINVGAVNVEAENASSGQFSTLFFCCTHEQPMNEESCAALLMGILGVAPSTRPRHTRMLRSMLEMNRPPLEIVILGLQKIASQSRRSRRAP
ncbi:phosphatidylinositol 3-related kinase, partial [Trypanosoma cruzi]